MTQTAKTLTLFLLTLILGLVVGAGIARLASTVTVDPASSAERQAVTLEASDSTAELTARGATTRAPAKPSSMLGTDYGIVRVALGDADFTDAQVTEVLASADRVCEGQRAGVPITTLEQTVAADSGLDMPTAHDFVALVLLVRC